MQTTPNYAIPYAEGTDPRRNYPSTVNQPAMVKIDAELARIDGAIAGGLGAPYGKFTRTKTDTFGDGTMQPLGVGVTLSAAPAGVYLVSWTILLTATAARPAYIRITANGANLSADGRADVDTQVRQYAGAVPHLHAAGGDLSLVSYALSNGSTSVYTGSMISLVRIGDAP